MTLKLMLPPLDDEYAAVEVSGMFGFVAQKPGKGITALELVWEHAVGEPLNENESLVSLIWSKIAEMTLPLDPRKWSYSSVPPCT